MNTDGFPTSYSEFCYLITQRCGTVLSREYCEQRMAALNDSSISSTRDFVKAYGVAHQKQVLAWYGQAAAEATV